MTDTAPIRVFVHLAHGFGAATWQARWDRGEIIGINDRLPYGYFWARDDGCEIEHSEDKPEGYFGRFLRLGVRVILGFDFVHAWRNRRGIAAAEVVWTHTESQHLAVLLLLRLRPNSPRPKLIAQSVWLFDRWQALSAVRRWFYKSLIARADILTVLSPENLKLARSLFPDSRSEMVRFGIRSESMVPRGPRPVHRPIHVLSLGNDRHRDWATLIDAVKRWDGCVLRLVTHAVDPAVIRSVPNVAVVHPKTNDELLALYDWADIVMVPITPNLHASGITVVEEATLCGLPVVCTDTGGLRAYFGDDEVSFVPPRQPLAIRDLIASLAKDDAGRWAMVERARERIIRDGLTSRRFAQRHAELSRELLSAADYGREPAAAGALTPRQERGRAGVLGRYASAALVAAGLAAAPNAAHPATLDLCRFRPTFIEDFNTLSVSAWGENGSRWIAHTPWRGDFGDAAFTDPSPGFPFRVENGVLQIEARQDAQGKWQSGLLASAKPDGSGFTQLFGYFEMRAQLPPGPGLWPAFWLNASQPKDATNPGVEIDVLEYYGQFTDGYHSVVHVWDKDPTKKRTEDQVTSVAPGSLLSGFHTYGVNVEKDWLTFYLDRRETWRTPTPPEMKDPSMVLVNLALGGGWPIDQTPNPSIMKVDYIHVYAPRAPGEPRSCPPETGSGADAKQ